jgi:hypothetical protein
MTDSTGIAPSFDLTGIFMKMLPVPTSTEENGAGAWVEKGAMPCPRAAPVKIRRVTNTLSPIFII